MPRITVSRNEVVQDVGNRVELRYSDVINIQNGDNRVYMVTVAPGFGGKSSGKAMLVNLETGDTRGFAPRKNIGPIDLATLTDVELCGFLGVDWDDMLIMPGDNVQIVVPS